LNIEKAIKKKRNLSSYTISIRIEKNEHINNNKIKREGERTAFNVYSNEFIQLVQNIVKNHKHRIESNWI